MSEAVIVAAIGLLSTISAGLFGLWQHRANNESKVKIKSLEREKMLAETEIQSHKEAEEFVDQAKSHLGETFHTLEDLRVEQGIGRIIFLKANNGFEDAKYCDEVWKLQDNYKTQPNYIGVEIDKDYRERLKRIKRSSYELVIVEELNDCLIKSIYEQEKVKSSLWVSLGTYMIPDTGVHVHLYFSFSNYKAEFSQDLITLCCLAVDKYRKFAADYFDVY